MKRYSERELVRTVAERWRKQYGRDPSGIFGGRDKAVILRQLEALDVETATAGDVAAIIGNKSWVSPDACDECGTASWSNVQVGQEPDYESATATLCADCLRKALALAEGAIAAQPEREDR